MFSKLISKNYRNFVNTNLIQKSFSKVTFIGGGKMAEGIINGLYSKNTNINMNVIEIDEKRKEYLKNKYKINTSFDLRKSDFILLCIKPQNIDTIQEYFKNYNILEDQVLISIIAGKSINQLQNHLPKVKNIIRVMPNIAVNINKGTLIWYPCSDIKNRQKNMTKDFLQILGDEIEVFSEDYIDMGTAISGTGPAYVFLLTESLIDSAVHIGFPRSLAKKLVLSTINGSSCLANERLHINNINNDNISNIRYDVTSPGGTTASAIYELEKGGLRTIINDSIWAAYRKTMELGCKDSRLGPGRHKY